MKNHVRGLFVARINEARSQLKTAGEIRRRDLRRQIGNMEKQLRIYDKNHEAARAGR